VELDEEFTADKQLTSFSDYLKLEDRLFEQLQTRVFDRIDTADRRLFNRFYQDSLSNPARWQNNWNRSFELETDNPQAGVLLLHGMSDSPYSLRALGMDLHRAGAWVTALRLPGHGTAPAGLVELRWQDMAAAVRLAMLHLQEQTGDRPIYILGYSTGAALAVQYTDTAFREPHLPQAAGLVMVSPAIGVTSLAAFAVWQARLGHLLGLDKLAWNAILPEYDPYKYGSFAVNAGDQVYRLTEEIRSALSHADAAGKLERFPPVLAFQSVVDASVSTPALISGLFQHLPPTGHELVLFDINRNSEIERLLVKDPEQAVQAMLDDPQLGFVLTLITNADGDSSRVVSQRNRPEGGSPEQIPLDLAWPEWIYSLSHVALPFPANDPLYGTGQSEQGARIWLGSLALRGEKGILQVPAADMLRQRWNPFYDYMQQRILKFMGLGGSAQAGVKPKHG
jgi:alpha-beta hydrolase superfamily lysophospholipase